MTCRFGNTCMLPNRDDRFLSPKMICKDESLGGYEQKLTECNNVTTSRKLTITDECDKITMSQNKNIKNSQKCIAIQWRG